MGTRIEAVQSVSRGLRVLGNLPKDRLRDSARNRNKHRAGLFPSWDVIFPYVLDSKADVLNLEQASRGGSDLHLLKEYPSSREVAIGAIDHRMIRVETPEEVAALARKALQFVDADKLLLTTDCGLGRQSLPRFQAYNKLRSLVAGAQIVSKKK